MISSIVVAFHPLVCRMCFKWQAAMSASAVPWFAAQLIMPHDLAAAKGNVYAAVALAAIALQKAAAVLASLATAYWIEARCRGAFLAVQSKRMQLKQRSLRSL